MKPTPCRQQLVSFTLIELLVTVVVAAGLVLLLLHLSVAARPRRSSRVNCVNNLSQVAKAFRLWGGDQDDKYPMRVSVTNGGTMELVPSGVVFPHFQVLSNELNNMPKTLSCPVDLTRSPATNFLPGLTDMNLSYFVGVDADETLPTMLLAGDRNLALRGTPLPHGLVGLAPNSRIGWTRELHKTHGNVAMPDGSVQQFTAAQLQEYLKRSGLTNRLAIP